MMRPRGESGQALVELMAVVVIFMFVGIASIETALLYHNMNAISNGLKQAAWAGANGAQDDKIGLIMEEAETNVILSAFLMHSATDFTIEVWHPAYDTAVSEAAIDPIATTQAVRFTGQALNAEGEMRRAAYLYRAEGMNIRTAIWYHITYFTPFFGSAPAFDVTLPLVVSQPCAARNDQDRDGLVDLYEDELFMGVAGEPTHFDLSHKDDGVSDTPLWATRNPAQDVDGDSRADVDEDTTPFANLDWDDDRIEDRFERRATSLTDTRNLLRHPIIGGPWKRVVVP